MNKMKNLNEEQNRDLMSQFESLRRTWWPSIRTLMDEVIRDSCPDRSLLHQMADYHLQTGGKHLRAILPLLIAEALGADPRRLIPFGAACEMLHNASLIHDDLQDGDEFRRGQPTVWKKFGMSQAINLGDAMIALTIILMKRLDQPAELRERATGRVLLEMLRVIEGQVQELELKDRADVTIADYMRMVERKTARLFSLPMSGAALLCGAPVEVEEGLTEAACHIGMLFQIQDDILDIYGEKGRQISGTDIAEGKRSMLVVHCLELIETQEAQWLKGILDKPRNQTSAEDIAGVMALFKRTGSLSFALDELERRRTAALEVPSLASYPALLKVLAEACSLFLYPISSIMREGTLNPQPTIS
jgi:geranylgeranyl diphosphate synthase, type I